MQSKVDQLKLAAEEEEDYGTFIGKYGFLIMTLLLVLAIYLGVVWGKNGAILSSNQQVIVVAIIMSALVLGLITLVARFFFPY